MATELTITIPDAYQARVINAFTEIGGANIEIRADKHHSNYMADWRFTLADKDAGESIKQYGERVLRELGKAVVNLVDKAEDEQRYRDEVAGIVPPVSDVPDNVLE